MRATFLSFAAAGSGRRQVMTEKDYQQKLDELDRLLNDPDVAMEPARIWSLLAELSHRDLAAEPHDA
jgi:hypothetical protein